jgi:hypothetical protein
MLWRASTWSRRVGRSVAVGRSVVDWDVPTAAASFRRIENAVAGWIVLSSGSGSGRECRSPPANFNGPAQMGNLRHVYFHTPFSRQSRRPGETNTHVWKGQE